MNYIEHIFRIKDGQGKTTNNVEGWHHAFKPQLQSTEPKVQAVIKTIQNEALRVEQLINRYVCNMHSLILQR